MLFVLQVGASHYNHRPLDNRPDCGFVRWIISGLFSAIPVLFCAFRVRGLFRVFRVRSLFCAFRAK